MFILFSGNFKTATVELLQDIEFEVVDDDNLAYRSGLERSKAEQAEEEAFHTRSLNDESDASYCLAYPEAGRHRT